MSKKNIKKPIIVGPWYFKIRITFTIVTVAVVTGLVYLGNWQLGRYFTKKHHEEHFTETIHEPPLLLSSIKDPQLPKDRFRPVTESVLFLNKYTFLLDNQVYKGQAGYRVLTIAQSPLLDNWLLVDRGWIAQGSSRNILPTIKEIYGLKKLTGIINNISCGISLSTEITDNASPWPRVIQTLDYQKIAQELHHPVYDFVLQLNSDDEVTYTMPPIEFNMPANKHLAYAFQWYTFAILVIVYYLLGTFSTEEE